MCTCEHIELCSCHYAEPSVNSEERLRFERGEDPWLEELQDSGEDWIRLAEQDLQRDMRSALYEEAFRKFLLAGGVMVAISIAVAAWWPF